jgi:hypothetical protein
LIERLRHHELRFRQFRVVSCEQPTTTCRSGPLLLTVPVPDRCSCFFHRPALILICYDQRALRSIAVKFYLMMLPRANDAATKRSSHPRSVDDSVETQCGCSALRKGQAGKSSRLCTAEMRCCQQKWLGTHGVHGRHPSQGCPHSRSLTLRPAMPSWIKLPRSSPRHLILPD